MTGSDPMPWGKYKGTPLKVVDKNYLQWLLKQDGFAEKNPAMAAWIKNGDFASSTPKEREVLATEELLLNSASVPFRQWWFRCYGDRLRKGGEVHYIAYLRVALSAWDAANRQLAEAALEPITPSVPLKPAYAPAPKPTKPTYFAHAQDILDEDVPF